MDEPSFFQHEFFQAQVILPHDETILKCTIDGKQEELLEEGFRNGMYCLFDKSNLKSLLMVSPSGIVSDNFLSFRPAAYGLHLRKPCCYERIK